MSLSVDLVITDDDGDKAIVSVSSLSQSERAPNVVAGTLRSELPEGWEVSER